MIRCHMKMIRKKIMSRRFTVTVILILTIGALLANCSGENSESGLPETDTDTAVDSVTFTVVAVESTNALQLLARHHAVDSRGSAVGSFVTAIDSVETGEGYYWLYSVNGEIPEIAADKRDVGPGDTVRWHFRRNE